MRGNSARRYLAQGSVFIELKPQSCRTNWDRSLPRLLPIYVEHDIDAARVAGAAIVQIRQSARIPSMLPAMGALSAG